MDDAASAGFDALIADAVEARREELIDCASTLVRFPTENPPSDTGAIAGWLRDRLSRIDGIELSTHCLEPPVVNLFARVTGAGAGRSLAFNGHLDTYVAGPHAAWSRDPFGGEVVDGRLHGRGACDMKGGIACSLIAFEVLAGRREDWHGELVMTLAGDEESMGVLGTQHLLDSVPGARTDAMICGDVGSPRVVRVGEKGMIWLDVEAEGRAAHGAHVHRGVNAIDRLMSAMQRLTTLRDMRVETPPEVARIIAAAAPVSEPLGGDGESRVMQCVTVNFGCIEGGLSPNLVAASARVRCDIRLPLGIGAEAVEAEIHRLLDPLDGITATVHRRYEPTWTATDEPIVEATLRACESVLGVPAVANMRIGASDARLYRAAGVPTVVAGLTPHNLGGPDEYAEVAEMVALARIHAGAAIRFLSATASTPSTGSPPIGAR